MFPSKLILFGICFLTMLLSACTTDIGKTGSANTFESVDSGICVETEKPEEQVKLQMIREMMDGGKVRAALAHLDALRIRSPKETYLRAEILRRIGQSDRAIPLYKQLIQGCGAGDGYHGLGLISGRNGKIKEALDYLGKAREQLPTDIEVRNDMGYALLLDKQYDSASHEFLTALELDENNEYSATNLVLLLLVTEEFQKAQSLASRMRLSDETFKSLLVQAAEIKNANPAKDFDSSESRPLTLGQDVANSKDERSQGSKRVAPRPIPVRSSRTVSSRARRAQSTKKTENR